MNKPCVWYVGGRSAGHIIPLLTLHAQHGGRALCITSNTPLDYYLVRNQPVAHVALTAGEIPRKQWWKLPVFLIRFVRDCFVVMKLLRKDRPDYIISSGGIVALPVVLTAWCARVPCDLFELNVVPGQAIRFLLPFARNIYYCFNEARAYLPVRAQWRGYPVRQFAAVDVTALRTAWRLSPERITLAVLGGSQGSQFLNTTMIQWLESLSPRERERVQVIHQTGDNGCQDVVDAYARLGIPAVVHKYFDNIQQVYAVTDNVVCRAGAGTLWELVQHHKRSLVIPLRTSATDHQVANAQALARQYPQTMWLLEQDQVMHQHDAIIAWLLQVPAVQERVGYPETPVDR